MASLILGPMLRHVTDTTATVWVETDGPCRVEVLGHTAPTFTVEGHHFALVVVRDLEPESVTPYEVRLDGTLAWPEPGSLFPPSVIRTTVNRRPVRILFGSCRAAAPHRPPYTLERDRDDDARGVDALWAHAQSMLGVPPAQWPDLAVFVGDQIYADDSSPDAAARIERRRSRHADDGFPLPPDDVVADFEEYTWLYHEAWSPPVERWFLSVVPTAMIFDDHDVIDDWNISDTWVQDIRQEPWWHEHIVSGLTSYWIYQHLGNLSPDEIAAEGMLAELERLGDGTAYLRRWAEESERFTPVPGGYRFSHSRDVGGVRLVVVDSRNGRVLDPAGRRMVDDVEWAWVERNATLPCDHLLVATSLPVFVPPGVHGLQQWSEALCAGIWGKRSTRVGEKLRRRIDLEAWSAFRQSFDDMLGLLARVRAGTPGRQSPATVTVISGDIHFAYVADITLPGADAPTVRQVVSSPMRNALGTGERGAIRFAASRVGTGVGHVLSRSARLPKPVHRFEMTDGPYFNNNIGLLTFTDGGSGEVVIERARIEGSGPVIEPVIHAAL